MNTKRIATLVSILMLAACPLAVAQDRPADGKKKKKEAAGGPDVREILRKADDATKALRAVSYKSEYYAEGEIADRVPHLTGTVKTQESRHSLLGRILGSPQKRMLRIEAVEQRPGSDQSRKFTVATDGERVYRLDGDEQRLTTGTLPDASELLMPATWLVMNEYLHPTPFSDELNGKSVRYEGRQKIGKVDCHVIFVVYANSSESRWYFGTEDFLPRRVDRVIPKKEVSRATSKGVAGNTVLIVTDLNTSPSLTREDFVIAPAKDVEKSEYDPRESPNREPLLEVGAAAPDWELSTPDGKTVALKDLRDDVVLMVFWATPYGSCKAMMPGVQQLEERFKDRPVKVLGLNCRETGDPVSYMKEQSYSFDLLLKADKVAEAYKVSGLPTIYVIDPEGKILYASIGFLPDKEKEIAKVIEKAIPKKD